MPFDSRLQIAIATLIIIPLCSYFYVTIVGYQDARALENCLDMGSGSSPVLGIQKTLIDRPDLQNDLQRILTPRKPSEASNYYLITGEHGTGKTTAIKQACRNVGSGVIYMEVPEYIANFALVFANATGFESRVSGFFPWLNQQIFGEKMIVSVDLANQGNWMPIYNKFKETAKWYEAKHGKVPVLVIDNVNEIAKQNPEMLQVLQNGAKSAIDNQHFVTVFVASDGTAPEQLTGRSAFSRGDTYRIWDINQKQVFEYLKKRGLEDVDGTLYSRVFNLVGGRLQTLNSVSTKLLWGQSFEDVKNSLFGDVKKHVDNCWKTFEPDEELICRAIVECINVKSECISEDLEHYVAKKSGVTTLKTKIAGVESSMVKENLLAMEGAHSTFHSNVEKLFFKEHPQVLEPVSS